MFVPAMRDAEVNLDDLRRVLRVAEDGKLTHNASETQSEFLDPLAVLERQLLVLSSYP